MVEGYQSRREVMERYPGTREVYLRGGKPMDEGDIFKQPELARTLLLLATQGALMVFIRVRLRSGCWLG